MVCLSCTGVHVGKGFSSCRLLESLLVQASMRGICATAVSSQHSPCSHIRAACCVVVPTLQAHWLPDRRARW
jgi:hypothetical protein